MREDFIPSKNLSWKLSKEVVGCLVCQHKDLNFDPQDPCEGQAKHASVTIHGEDKAGMWLS